MLRQSSLMQTPLGALEDCFSSSGVQPKAPVVALRPHPNLLASRLKKLSDEGDLNSYLRALVDCYLPLRSFAAAEGHESGRAVEVLIHVPAHDCLRPLAGLLLAGKGPAGGIPIGIWRCGTVPRNRGNRSTPVGASRSAARPVPPAAPPELPSA